MNLAEERHLFRTISGRYDLTEADAGNLGDFFLNEGSKWLDRLDTNQNSFGSFIQVIAAGTWYLQFPFCRALKEVWAATAASGRWQLEKQTLQDLIVGYLCEPPAEVLNGAPLYYSPSYARYIPESLTPAEIAAFSTYILTPPKADYGYNTVIFAAPVDESTLIELKGLFYSAQLSNDEDQNYWSSEHPLILALAAVRQVHMAYGNFSGMEKVDVSLRDELKTIGMDLVEQQIAEVDEMGD